MDTLIYFYKLIPKKKKKKEKYMRRNKEKNREKKKEELGARVWVWDMKIIFMSVLGNKK